MKTPKDKPKLPGTYAERLIARHLARAPPQHRTELARFFEAKRAQGVKENTLVNYGYRVGPWLEYLGDRSLPSATAEDVAKFFNSLTDAGYNGAMVSQAAVLVKAFMEFVLIDTPRPKSFWRAFKRRAPPPATERKPPTPAEIELLINAGCNPMSRCIIAVLADSGFRISELVALNVGSVTFEDDGTGWLSIPSNSPRLKTGPRTVPILDAVPELKRYLTFHEMRNDPNAPLFYSERQRSRHQLLHFSAARSYVIHAAARAGIRHMHPHLLRHARATKATRDGWNEITMRKFFGWAKGSDMPDHYSHLENTDLKNAVLRSADRIPEKPSLAAGSAPPPAFDDAPKAAAHDLLAAFGALGDLLQAAQHARKPRA